VFLESVEIEGYRAATVPLVVHFPGRLSVIVGGNNSGKTTICDAIYQALPNHFPPVRRPIADVVHLNTGSIRMSFSGSGDSASDILSHPGSRQQLDTKIGRKQGRASFTRESSSPLMGDGLAKLMGIYLPADRQPVQELGRENSLLIVQLLRTVSLDKAFDGDLGRLYDRARELLNRIIEDPLVVELERRLRKRMASVSGGSANQIPYVGTSAMDQRLLARILELLLGEGSEESARRLELSGLGYANLLYLAAILTALPQSEPINDGEGSGVEGPEGKANSVERAPAAAAVNDEDLEDAAGEQSDGDVFPRHTPLFVLLVEEPEAHLHPQLQAGVLQELRRLVAAIPTLQVIITTHSAEILAMAEPEELIVLPGQRVTAAGVSVLDQPVTLTRLGEKLGNKWDETRRMLKLHLDATRSGAVFADEVMLVEGPTDALIFRRFGLLWAKVGDPSLVAAKTRFVRALSIVPMNQKVGEWPIRLLVTKTFEICWRVAVVRDSDKRPVKVNGSRVPLTESWLAENPPLVPKWLKAKVYDLDKVGVFHLHPTLEPALWLCNKAFVETALTSSAASSESDDEDDDSPLTAEPGDQEPVVWTLDSVDQHFRTDGGKKQKAQVSLRLADHFDKSNPGDLVVPEQLAAAFDFLWAGFVARAAKPKAEVTDGSTTPTET
jgi:putative ATP-dependent endonuclease of the OLD family